MLTNTLETDVSRIQNALKTAHEAVKRFVPGTFAVNDNGGRDVITQVDPSVSDVLHTALLKGHEGLALRRGCDDLGRLPKQVVWVVDPLNGAREFVDDIPEWCISLGLVVDGTAVAGGVCNPATNEVFTEA